MIFICPYSELQHQGCLLFGRLACGAQIPHHTEGQATQRALRCLRNEARGILSPQGRALACLLLKGKHRVFRGLEES